MQQVPLAGFSLFQYSLRVLKFDRGGIVPAKKSTIFTPSWVSLPIYLTGREEIGPLEGERLSNCTYVLRGVATEYPDLKVNKIVKWLQGLTKTSILAISVTSGGIPSNRNSP